MLISVFFVFKKPSNKTHFFPRITIKLLIRFVMQDINNDNKTPLNEKKNTTKKKNSVTEQKIIMFDIRYSSYTLIH